MVCVCLFGAGNAFGQVKTISSLSTAVSPSSRTRYSDLVKLVFLDLSPEDGAAHQTIPIRHVSGDHERMALHGDFKIDSLEAIQLHDSAKRFAPSAGGNLERLDKLNEGRM
jgi:hypothetical protein